MMPARVFIPVDPEAARIMTALGLGAGVICAYFAAKHLDRQANGSGVVETKTLAAFLRDSGLDFAARTFARWMARGSGTLWNMANGRLYLYQLSRLTPTGALRGRLNLARMALDAGRPELVSTNPPGARYIEVEMAAGQQWTANLYAAWLASRIKPDRLQAFSRFTLGSLWGVSRNVLMKWERRAAIVPVRAITQYDLEVADLIPAHAEPYVVRTADGITFRARAWHSNLFERPDVVMRNHSRLPRDRRHAALATLETASIPKESVQLTLEDQLRLMKRCSDPATQTAARGFKRQHREAQVNQPGSCRSFERTGRLDFYDNRGRRFVPPHKRIRSHLRQHGDVERVHYAHLGIDRRGRHVFEASIGSLFTWLDEALSRRAAQAVFARISRHAVASIWRSA